MIGSAQQNTLKEPVTVSGVGVHTGLPVTMTIKPSSANTGRVFVRTDMPESEPVPALVAYVDSSIHMSTALRKGDVLVRTTEHVLAALVAYDIDNAIIELDAVECPIMDGSAMPFLEAMQAVGRDEQDAPAEYLALTDVTRVGDDKRWASIEPQDHFSAEVTIVYEHPAFTPSEQTVVFDAKNDSFATAFAAARTFGFVRDFEPAKQMGYALGSSLENTIAFDDEAMVNETSLRFSDECVRHKCLDAVGDLALLGKRLTGRFTSYCSGHAQTADLMRHLLA